MSTTDASRLTFESTSAMIEKQMTFGMNANIVTIPASTSTLTARELLKTARSEGAGL